METTSSHVEDRGAGGKLRRNPARKPPAKPYSRPPPAPAEQRRWLSKLVVDPACRIITGGASLLFPSFFSQSPTTADDAAADEDRAEEESEAVFERTASGEDQNCAINLKIINTNGLKGPSKADNVSESISDMAGKTKEVKSDDEKGLSDIELLLKGKVFSRDEVNRLVGMINSRAVEASSKEKEKKKDQYIDARAEAKELPMSQEIIDLTSESKQKDLAGSSWQPSTPLPQSFMLDEVCASPVDIAKAYMGSRTLETGNHSKGSIRNNEISTLYGSDFATRPHVPSPSPKPSAHWPGSMVQDQRDYFTPQTHRGRYGLHNFPRTPYSRTIFSKTKSNVNQLQGDNDKWAKPPVSLQKSQTPIFGQEKSKGGMMEDSYGSIGPIRRSRHKIGAQTPFNGSVFGSSSVGPSRAEKSKFPQVERNFESGATSSGFKSQSVDRKNRSLEVGAPTVHPHSSQIARSILEHIDRNPPTPKEKLEELKIAFAWKNPDSSASSHDPNRQNSLLNSKESDSQKIVNPGKSNSLLFAPSQENAFSGISTQNNPSRSDVFLNNGTDLIKAKSSHEVMNQQKKPPISGTKPVLSSISIDKPSPKWKFSTDQSFSFTFPVSTASGVLSEPPTPSIIPSFSSNDQNHRPTEKADIPVYTFGSTNSEPALVFSFPSTSSAGGETDTSDINFSFGSDQPRLSFGSVGKNTICY